MDLVERKKTYEIRIKSRTVQDRPSLLLTL